MARATMTFPADFLWGTATASHHVEGNNTNNDWWLWEQAGHIFEQQTSDLACNWWDFDTAIKDLNMAADMGTNAHRLSIEWSRIEPQPSVFDTAAINQYRDLLLAMKARGIEPMVTLHHFTNPQWLVEKGDFNTPLIVDYFSRYTQRAVEAFGDLVPKWITINEPMVYFFMRYMSKAFPQPKEPGGMLMGRRAVWGMLAAHAAAYRIIKAHNPAAQVGVAKQFVHFEPWPNSQFPTKLWTNQVSWVFNDMWMDAITTGKLPALIGGRKIEGLANSYDFVGINYYSRRYLKFASLDTESWPSSARLTDTGYSEPYPHGLFKLIEKAHIRYRKPIYITENGLPDIEDRRRPEFILTHLREIWKAVCYNYPVMGYYHWSLIDNFEWDRGWSQRFGLIGLDPETQMRQLRPSGRMYGEICRSATINSDMAEKYAPQLMSRMFPGRRPGI